MEVARTAKVNSKTQLAKTLGVSRSSLYYQPKRTLIDNELKCQVEAVMVSYPAYGHRRIAWELKFNKKRILRIMRKFGLKPFRRRAKYPPKPEDQNRPPAKFENLIKGFCPIRPNVVWATDFTYISFQGRFIYLATVIDVFTREIIGWNISRFHNQQLVVGALLNAMANTKAKSIYHHSDQGAEYESIEYIELLQDNGIIISMSAKASPWENPFQESYYSQFKVELADVNRFELLGELVENIYQTIYDYNMTRIHTALKTSPVKFKEQYLKNLLLFDADKVS